MLRAIQAGLLQKITGAQEKRNAERSDQRNDCTGAEADAQIRHRKTPSRLKRSV